MAAVTAVAQQAEDALERIDDDGQQLGDETLGFASAARRRELGRLRAELFRLGQTQAAHRNMLIAHDELSDMLEQQHRSRLNQAAATFRANQSTATRLYAMVGDVLDEQATVVSERLTVVATIFLPLTLATGFFGMNFQWMLDRLDSLASFLLLGLLAPAVLTVLTVFGPRLLNAGPESASAPGQFDGNDLEHPEQENICRAHREDSSCPHDERPHYAPSSACRS